MLNIGLLRNEQYISNADGEVEFIVLPAKVYKRLLDFIEDYGLGMAIREAEDDKRYDIEEGLNFLESEDENRT